MASIVNDLRYGLRMVRKQPGSSLTAITALALGIGLTAMMFSIVYGAILRGLPFEKPHQIVRATSTELAKGRDNIGVRMHDFEEWRSQQHSFTDLAASNTGSVNLSDGITPERFEAAWVSPQLFTVLGEMPILGRAFTEADAATGAPEVIIIDYDNWKTRYEGRADVIGSVLRVNGTPSTVVGVMSKGFAFPQSEHVWLPLKLDLLRTPRGGGAGLDVVGRLRDGVTIDAAKAELNGIARRIAAAHPDSNKGIGATVMPYIEGQLGKEPVALLFTMLGAVFMVLLIACTNVANLMIARSAGRSKEVAVRSALGASKFRIVRQFLAESLIMAAVGALLGLGIAFLGARLFSNAIAGTNPPFWIHVTIDRGVLLFAFAITAIATILSGTVPAINASRIGVGEVLKDEARGSSSRKMGRLIRVLVIVEIAMSAGLLVAAGLMIRSLTELRSVDLGFPTREVFTGRVRLSSAEYPTPASQDAFYTELLTRIQALPNVQNAALTSGLPTREGNRTTFAVEGVTYQTADEHPPAGTVIITPSYFSALGVGAVAGRMLMDADAAGSMPVALVTRSFARRHFDGNALGRRIRVDDGANSAEPFRTIVGVVPDLYVRGFAQEDQSAIYVPFSQSTSSMMNIVARVQGPPMSITKDVRTAAASIDPDQPLSDVRTLQEYIDANNWFYGVFGSLFVVFGLAALFLASVGLYGVMSTSVHHRKREMGVRMAMGANSRDLLRLVLNEGLLQLALGLTFGLAFALLLSKLVSTLLFRVQPRDPATFIGIALLLTVTALTATLIPASRASRVQPVQALRDE